jgi:hypothetical protein
MPWISFSSLRYAYACTSQTYTAAAEKMLDFFNSPSIIAGIVLNIDEDPIYASPKKAKKWDLAKGDVLLKEWDGLGLTLGS